MPELAKVNHHSSPYSAVSALPIDSPILDTPTTYLNSLWGYTLVKNHLADFHYNNIKTSNFHSMSSFNQAAIVRGSSALPSSSLRKFQNQCIPASLAVVYHLNTSVDFIESRG